jgi:hypothetical protein
MCANCRTAKDCNCTGGYPCPVCSHEPAMNVGADQDLVVEMLSPDLQVGLE